MSSRSRTSLILLAVFSISLFSCPIQYEVSADGINIIDYDYEGILPESTQYFVINNIGSRSYDLQANISALEFEGATGWPDFQLAVYDFWDPDYSNNYLASSKTHDNYSCRIFFEAESEGRYVIAISNLDPVDDAVYNISIISEVELDFQYTSMFDMDDYDSDEPESIVVTYFERTNPYYYRMNGYGDTRVVIEWIPLYDDVEYYFMIYNKGETCDLFIGLLGLPYYSYMFPDLTASVADFEDLDAGKEDTELVLFTIANYSTGGFLRCESGHRYRFWIDPGIYEPVVHIIFDSLGGTPLDFNAELLSENPDGVVSLRPSRVDPWIEFRQTSRDVIYWALGIGGISFGGIAFSVWYLRKRYY
ncbi:MAG: hypothetical protein ACFFED_17925 [Candidatus Thorarchaeota archaeon]